MECAVNSKVHKWLLNQPWIGQFIDNLRNEGAEPEDMLLSLLGRDGKGTIGNAFCWEDTPEGHDFWSEKDSQLIDLWEENKWSKSTVHIKI